jgi:hypothetical protein
MPGCHGEPIFFGPDAWRRVDNPQFTPENLP